jgi:opacity protein-like surface antigen
MNRHFVLFAAILVPCVAQAQTPTAMQKRAMQGGEGGSHIEFTGFGGMALGNELYQAGGAELGLDDGSTFGGRAAFFPNPKLGIELSYAQTSGELGVIEGTTGFANPAPYGDLKVQQADVAALLSQGADSKAKTQGYMIVGAGATRFRGDAEAASGSTESTRFAWLAGLGTKLRVGDSAALRLEGRYRSTNTDGNDVVYTDANGNPYGYDAHWYRTWEITAGLNLKL